MPISSDVSEITYPGPLSISQALPVPFKFLENDYLVVLEQDTDGDNSVTLVEDTDYSVSGAGDEAGGTVTMLKTVVSGRKAFIQRVPPITQLDKYEEDDPFPADVTTDALDKRTMVEQYLKRQNERSLSLPAGSTASAELPVPSADEYIGWNGGATALENKPQPTLTQNSFDDEYFTVSGSPEDTFVLTSFTLDSKNSGRIFVGADATSMQLIDQDEWTLSGDDTIILDVPVAVGSYVGVWRIEPLTGGGQEFSGTAGVGGQSVFDIGFTVNSELDILVFVGGTFQNADTFSVTGTDLTFSSAVPEGEDVDVFERLGPTGPTGPQGPAGLGDVVGPASSTDNEIPRFDGTDGETLQGSSVIIDDSQNVSGINDLSLTGTVDGRDVAADGVQLDTFSDIRSISSAQTLAATDNYVFCDASGGAYNVSLPAGTDGKIYNIKKTDSSSNAVSIQTDAAETIDGQAFISLLIQYDSVTIIWNGTEWSIV